MKILSTYFIFIIFNVGGRSEFKLGYASRIDLRDSFSFKNVPEKEKRFYFI